MRVSPRAPVPGFALAIWAVLALLAAGCFDPGEEARVFVNGTAVATAVATATPAAAERTVPALEFTPTPFTSDLDPADLRGFVFPITDACLPSRDEVMPNAPRAYRNGVHEGVDFYHGDVCTPISLGLSVVAMHAGIVTRADLDHRDITPEQVETLAARTEAQGFSDPETLDIYRGRQVWIDHGNGVMSRYAHLASIADGIDVGVEVAAGEVIAAVGESGTPESITAPGTEVHLHAEVRIGGGFLGEGLPPAEVRRLYERLFSVPGEETTPPPPAADDGAGDGAEPGPEGETADDSAPGDQAAADDAAADDAAESDAAADDVAADDAAESDE